MIKYLFLSVFALTFTSQLAAQEIQKRVLPITQQKSRLIKVINLDETTTLVFKKQGSQVVVDAVIEKEDRRLIITPPSKQKLKVKEIFDFNNQVLVICSHLSKKDKKEVYTAHFLDLKTGRLSEPKELFRQNLVRPGLLRGPATFACSKNGQYLSVFHPKEQVIKDKYSINVSTFNSSLDKIYTISDEADFPLFQSVFKNFVVDNKGASHILFKDHSQAPSQYSYVESSQYTRYWIYSYHESGRLTDGIVISDEPITSANIEVLNDDHLIMAGLQGRSTLKKDLVIGILAFKLTPSNGESEVIIDSKLTNDYIKAHVAKPDNLIKTGELKMNKDVKILVDSENNFSIFSQMMRHGESSTSYGDIMVATYTPNGIYTHIIGRTYVTTETDFAYLNGKLMGLMFKSGETYYRQDLIFLSVGEEVEQTQILSREESLEIKLYGINLTQFPSTEKVMFLAQKSALEYILYTISMN